MKFYEVPLTALVAVYLPAHPNLTITGITDANKSIDI